MLILAIDQSPRNTGFCVFDFEQRKPVLVFPFVTTAENFYRPEFLIEHKAVLIKCLEKYKPFMVTIEGTALNSTNLTFSLGALFAMISLELFERKIPTIVSPPMRWKKVFTSTGHMEARGDHTKSKIKEAALYRYPFLEKRLSSDCYDAVGLAYFAACCLAQHLNKPWITDRDLVKLICAPEKGTLNNPNFIYNL